MDYLFISILLLASKLMKIPVIIQIKKYIRYCIKSIGYKFCIFKHKYCKIKLYIKYWCKLTENEQCLFSQIHFHNIVGIFKIILYEIRVLKIIYCDLVIAYGTTDIREDLRENKARA